MAECTYILYPYVKRNVVRTEICGGGAAEEGVQSKRGGWLVQAIDLERRRYVKVTIVVIRRHDVPIRPVLQHGFEMAGDEGS